MVQIGPYKCPRLNTSNIFLLSHKTFEEIARNKRLQNESNCTKLRQLPIVLSQVPDIIHSLDSDFCGALICLEFGGVGQHLTLYCRRVSDPIVNRPFPVA